MRIPWRASRLLPSCSSRRITRGNLLGRVPRLERIVLQVDPVARELRLAFFEECLRTFTRVLMEHQLDIAQNLLLDTLDRIERETLVARILDGAHRRSRTFGQSGRKLVSLRLEFFL